MKITRAGGSACDAERRGRGSVRTKFVHTKSWTCPPGEPIQPNSMALEGWTKLYLSAKHGESRKEGEE